MLTNKAPTSIYTKASRCFLIFDLVEHFSKEIKQSRLNFDFIHVLHAHLIIFGP